MKTSDIFNENAEDLNIGDPVIITGNVQFKGKTGDIVDFGKDKRFVIVNLYNYGKHSFHSSDVSYNDYADSGQEEADAYDRDADARDWMHKQEVGESKPGTKFVGKWKGTDSAAKAKQRLVGETSNTAWRQEKLNPTTQYVSQGHVIKFTPTELQISKGGEVVYTKSGDFSAPTKAQKVQAKGMVTKLAAGWLPSKIAEAKSLQSKFEKHLARHGYDVGEKSKYWEKKLKDIDAQIAAWDAEMERRKQAKSGVAEDLGTMAGAAALGSLAAGAIGAGVGTWLKKDREKQQDKMAAITDPKKKGVAENYDSEELANEVYAEFERTYPQLARHADERTVHAAIVDVLNYGGDNNPAALAQDVARAVERDTQGVAETSLKQRVKTTMRKLDPTIKGRLKDRADDEFDLGLEKDSDDWISGAPGSAHMKHAAHLRRLARGEKPFTDHKKGVAEASMGSLMAAGKLQKDREESNRRAKAGSAELKTKNAAAFKKAQDRDAAWWKAQDDAHKSGKNTFDFDGKTHPLKGKGVAEGEYDDPRWEPREPDMSRKVDWDIEAERNKLEEPVTPTTVTVRDGEGNVVLQFPSTGGYYGDVRYAKSKGFDTEAGDYDIKWKRDANEDTMMSEDSGATSEQVASEIVRRIIFKHKDAISAYGPEAIMAAAREVGEYFAGAEELGSSDISIATKYTLDKLEQMGRGALGESASAGGTSAGAVATTVTGGAGKNVGSLFGGTYKQKRTKKSPGTK